jgi:hypothetical protein
MGCGETASRLVVTQVLQVRILPSQRHAPFV